jgi:hypothetical protein
MGTGFDCFDTLAHTLDPRITGVQRANRLLLKSAMEKAGFVNLPTEWWHYTYRPAPYPNTYFNFPVARSSLTGRRRPAAIAPRNAADRRPPAIAATLFTSPSDGNHPRN